MQINHLEQAPHLPTGTMVFFEKQFIHQEKEIENWFKEQWLLSPAPVYGSVDLRNAGFKLAPVDMNLFPAGFNNLNVDFMPLYIDAARKSFIQFLPNAKRILIIPENHTRNIFYWDNINMILSILKNAGFEARIGSLLEEIPKIALKNGESISLEPLTRTANKISVNGFYPDIILLNNDLSSGIPNILQNLEQPIIPPAELGWHQRLKSGHFQYYADVSNDFAKLVDIDPWFIAPMFRHCGQIDFMQREGEDCLTKNTGHLLESIQKKYNEYGITHKPFVIVKADAGTYGMAVMTVRDIEEVQSLNRKQRAQMAKSKGGQPVHRVIVQEGVYTFETWGEHNSVAEPVVYLWGENVVGGFYRVHNERGADENLNTPGMHFQPLAFACHKQASEVSNECQNRFYTYGVIARLSMLAAAREILEQKK